MSSGFTLPSVLEIHALAHPDERVQRVGFSLDHPYVEQCWVGIIGPSSVLLLRRLPELWREATPARVDVRDLALSVGLGASINGRHSRIWRTFDRLRQFGLVTPVEGESIGVYAQVRPIPERLLGRLPGWSLQRHEDLVAGHLERLAGGSGATPADAMRTRLDRLEQRNLTVPTIGGPS